MPARFQRGHGWSPSAASHGPLLHLGVRDARAHTLVPHAHKGAGRAGDSGREIVCGHSARTRHPLSHWSSRRKRNAHTASEEPQERVSRGARVPESPLLGSAWPQGHSPTAQPCSSLAPASHAHSRHCSRAPLPSWPGSSGFRADVLRLAPFPLTHPGSHRGVGGHLPEAARPHAASLLWPPGAPHGPPGGNSSSQDSRPSPRKPSPSSEPDGVPSVRPPDHTHPQ